MTKVGIITILKVNNYGAELQAYATQKVLQLMGYDAEIIDYLFYKNPRHKRTRLSSPTAKVPIKKRLQETLYPIIANWKSRKFRDAQNARNVKFEQFHSENTRLSVCYDTLDKLISAELDYDVLMTGSDQVWNPGIYSSLDPYFLRFGSQKMKRIAYASSFGVSSIPDNLKDYYKESLIGYSAVGVREDTALGIVESLSGKKAQLVIDPTLLLTQEQWLEVAKLANRPNVPYILIYELAKVPYIKQVAQHISRLTGMPIVRICKNASPEDVEPEITNVIDAGPAEFLTLFANASYVVTNSFHGTAFSLNFGKQFYTVIPKGKENNSRQKSILKLLGCEDRMLLENSALPEIKDYDVARVQAQLAIEREKSMDFLRNSIDG